MHLDKTFALQYGIDGCMPSSHFLNSSQAGILRPLKQPWGPVITSEDQSAPDDGTLHGMLHQDAIASCTTELVSVTPGSWWPGEIAVLACRTPWCMTQWYMPPVRASWSLMASGEERSVTSCFIKLLAALKTVHVAISHTGHEQLCAGPDLVWQGRCYCPDARTTPLLRRLNTPNMHIEIRS